MHVANAVTAALAAFAGLFAGTYATTLVARIPGDEAVTRPLGRCPRCRHVLRPSEMMPVVSWLSRRGRCRYCGAPYGVRYLGIELVTAAACGLVAGRIGPSPSLPAFLYLTVVCVALAAIDIAVRRLPDALTLPSYPATAGLLLLAVPHTADGPRHLVHALLGMAGLGLFYLVLFLISPNGMAFGDVKLSGVLGLGLGWLGAGAVVVGAFAAFLFGAAYGVGLMAAGKGGRKTTMPFGPFMALGALVGVLAGTAVRW